MSMILILIIEETYGTWLLIINFIDHFTYKNRILIVYSIIYNNVSWCLDFKEENVKIFFFIKLKIPA